jgi:hypothetical protein
MQSTNLECPTGKKRKQENEEPALAKHFKAPPATSGNQGREENEERKTKNEERKTKNEENSRPV